jgi:hypothetical protein
MYPRRRCPSVRCALTLCVAALLTGCGSSGRVQVTIPAARLGGYNTALVQASSGIEDTKKEAIQLEATAAMIARNKLPFQQVLTKRDSPEALVELRVEARIVQLERVTALTKELYGKMAGRARLVAEVVLVDAATGNVVARFTAEGQSSTSEGMEQAIKRAAEQIVAFVAAHLNGAAPVRFSVAVPQRDDRIDGRCLPRGQKTGARAH